MIDETTGRGAATGPSPSFLAGYPHVARCAQCRAYADDHLGLAEHTSLLVATLGHHASSHACDPLTVASQHFA
jgi:hypothetical protein